ncbi:hypothetical protein SJI00_22145 [Pseudomonas sp. RP23018S]|uniref:hypothetical protein n=1 Tax=Pseudomonas sp. RP23018S TaxID=3096037 RepID=UPI002ACA14F8|nr:hypothetical protein [Pseudomonas sp. RP23018S]MDZ5605480.1 hypothetical protein [Pseudomonas sp. RP23018S]
MHDAPPSATGNLIKAFGYGKALQIFAGVFAISLLGLAAYLGYLRTVTAFPGEPAPAGATSTFNGPPEIFYYIMGGLVFMALCLVLTMRWQKKLRNARYEVYEKGIRQITAEHDEFVAFAEMDDLYLFASGQTITAGLINNLAYRRNASEPFRRVNAHLHQLEEFMDLVRERYLEERMPLATQTLSNGGVVRFNYADTQQVWKKRFSGNFLEVATKPLSITLHYLEVDGKRYPISLLREANTSAWTEKVVIKDNDGQVVLSTIATGIMSMDLFMNVLDWLQHVQTAPSASKVAADY